MELRVVSQGPFTLRPSFARDQWYGTSAVVLFMLVAGPALIVVYALYERQLDELERRWAAYQPAAEAADYEGKIRTHNLILRSYELQVSFRTQEGAPVSFQSDFWRLLNGPQTGDLLYVRYDPAAPSSALTSWEFESTRHGHHYALAALIAGLANFLFGLVIVRDIKRRVAVVAGLARDSQLVVATVEKLQQFGMQSIITFRMPNGSVLTQAFQAKFGPPYFLNGTKQLLVLSSLDERTAQIVREDGYPLAERPRLKGSAA